MSDADGSFGATLIVLGEELDPEAVTGLLGIVPRKAWRRGQQKSFVRHDGTTHFFDSFYTNGGWKHWLDDEWHDRHLNVQLSRWSELLSERAAAVKALRGQGHTIEMNCCVVASSTVVQVPADTQKVFSTLGVDLSITFYPRGERLRRCKKRRHEAALPSP